MKLEIEIKFNLQDPVYYMQDNKVSMSRVSQINIDHGCCTDRKNYTHVLYMIHDGKKFTGEQLFPSREELLKSL